MKNNLGKLVNVIYEKIGEKQFFLTEIHTEGNVVRYATLKNSKEFWTNPYIISTKDKTLVNQNMDNKDFYEASPEFLDILCKKEMEQEYLEKIAKIKPSKSRLFLSKEEEKFLEKEKDKFIEKTYFRDIKELEELLTAPRKETKIYEHLYQTPYLNGITQDKLLGPLPRIISLAYSKKKESISAIYSAIYGIKFQFKNKKIVDEKWTARPIAVLVSKKYRGEFLTNLYVYSGQRLIIGNVKDAEKASEEYNGKYVDAVYLPEIKFDEKQIRGLGLVAMGQKKFLTCHVDVDKDDIIDHSFLYKIKNKELNKIKFEKVKYFDVIYSNKKKEAKFYFKNFKNDKTKKFSLEQEIDNMPVVSIERNGTTMIRLYEKREYGTRFTLKPEEATKYF